jgi:hypothetical protein
MLLSLVALPFATKPLAAQQSRAVISLPGFREPFRIEDVAVPYDFDAPIGKVYGAIRASFADLKIPVIVDDSMSGIIGNGKLQASGVFADTRLSRLLDCGAGAIQQNADTYRLSIVLLVLVDADSPTRTKARIGFIGGGQDLGGTSKGAVNCGSSGKFEERLQGLIAKHLH